MLQQQNPKLQEFPHKSISIFLHDSDELSLEIYLLQSEQSLYIPNIDEKSPNTFDIHLLFSVAQTQLKSKQNYGTIN